MPERVARDETPLLNPNVLALDIFRCAVIGLHVSYVPPSHEVSWVSDLVAFASQTRSATTNHRGKTMFRKQRLSNSGVTGSNADLNRCEWIQLLSRSQFFSCLNPPAKKQRVADGAKILLDVAKESADWFPPLKSALGGVNALIKHYEVLVESVAVTHN